MSEADNVAAVRVAFGATEEASHALQARQADRARKRFSDVRDSMRSDLHPKRWNPSAIKKDSLTIMEQFQLARHLFARIEKMQNQAAEIFEPIMLGARRSRPNAGRSSVVGALISRAGEPAAHIFHEEGWCRAARSLIKLRSARRRFFRDDIFSDPAWDMLLELYALEGEGRRVSVSKLSLASGVPGTTALRWLDKLEAQSLVVREDDPADGRRVWIKLSPSGASAMDSYFRELAAQPSAR